MDEARVTEIVRRVLEGMREETAPTGRPTQGDRATPSGQVTGHGVFETPEAAIDAANAAQREFAAGSLEMRRQCVDAMREAGRRRARELAAMAVDETGMGRVEDKVLKNENAANLTPGLETLDADTFTGDDGVLIIERGPMGTINAIAPITNPTSTVINNAIIMLSAGNSVVFSPHPSAARCTLRTMCYLNDAIVEVGGPRSLLTSVSAPSLRQAKLIMEHERVDVVCATGGSGVVRVALAAGKKAFAAGPGNPPAVIDETADVDLAAQAVVDGASFDNDLLCVGEKACFIHDSIADRALQAMIAAGGQQIRGSDLPALMKAIVTDGHMNPDLVGKDAAVILGAAGIRASGDPRVILVETSADHELVIDEFLMPIVPCVRVKSFEEAVRGAVAAEGGRGHTATLHTKRLDRVQAFSKALQVGVLVVNGPSFAAAGIGGPGFLSMTIAGRTGEGFTTPRHFTTERRTSLIGAVSIFGQA